MTRRTAVTFRVGDVIELIDAVELKYRAKGCSVYGTIIEIRKNAVSGPGPRGRALVQMKDSGATLWLSARGMKAVAK